jgi:hypothetical protein
MVDLFYNNFLFKVKMNQQSINFSSLLENLSKDYLYKNVLEHSKTKYNIKLYNI